MTPSAGRVIFLLGLIVVLAGCQTPRTPAPILEDEEFQQITRGRVDLRLGILPPTFDKQDLEDDDVAAIIYDGEALRETLVEEIQAAGPFAPSSVVPMGTDQLAQCLSSDFDPNTLPADVYLKIRMRKYQVSDEGHNAALILNLFMLPILPLYPLTLYVADETYQARLTAEVQLISLYSNGLVMPRKVYRDITWEADLDELDDDPWEHVSEEVADQAWRKLTLQILGDLHSDFVAAVAAEKWPVTLGKIERLRQWEVFQRKEAAPAHYAYILGVGKYLNPELPSPEYVEDDLDRVTDYLKKRARDLWEVHPYIGRTAGSAASREFDSGALTALREITENVTEKDTLLLYLAGKGAVIRTEEGTSSYFLLYDSDLAADKIRQTSLPLDTLKEMLGQAKARQIIVVMDLRDIEYRELTQVGEGGGAAEGPPSDFYEGVFSGGEGRLLLASAHPGQIAHESDAVGLGSFTHYLLEGVDGPADTDGDGVITVKEVYEYLQPRLGKFARLNGMTQEPLLVGEEFAGVPVIPD